jgi:hypothetical protein
MPIRTANGEGVYCDPNVGVVTDVRGPGSSPRPPGRSGLAGAGAHLAITGR